MSNFSRKDVTTHRRESVFEGFFKMVRYQFTHKKYDGSQSELVTREVFERGHAVAVLPYDPVLNEFVLIEQFRYPALATTDDPWLIEVIAGIIEEGEDEPDVCVREAKEEGNIDIFNLVKVLSYLSSPGGTTERLHIYVAQVDASNASGVHGLENEAEDIRVCRVKEAEARQWLAEGKIDNAAAIIALQWFYLNKEDLLARWEALA
ncbi:ADP-ribose diphosphatase [Glaciecola sp. XM2]|nr:ADP-ribose diphosphatase [Glaciecola sp. XM2]